MSKVIKCTRCHRRCRNSGGWNGTFVAGRCVGYLCPGCQSPEENAEAEINEATTDYGLDQLGRLVGRPRFGGVG